MKINENCWLLYMIDWYRSIYCGILKAKMEIEDLFTDLADGIKLLKLLEIISSEKLGKPNNGRMRVHKIENVNKSLAFLHTKVCIITLIISIIYYQYLYIYIYVVRGFEKIFYKWEKWSCYWCRIVNLLHHIFIWHYNMIHYDVSKSL